MPIFDSFNYFSENLKGPERDKLLFIAGSLAPFDDIFHTYMVGNQKGAPDFDPDKPESILCVFTDSDNDDISLTIYPNGAVFLDDAGNLGMRSTETTDEEYEMTLNELHNWLRSQPPKWNRFAKYIL